ncbi:hypothetical protein [Streptomyces sp. NPDC002851]
MHVMDDPAALTTRAQRFLATHGHRSPPADPERLRAAYRCEDATGGVVSGPPGGLGRMLAFNARVGGLRFCSDRPQCRGKHRGYVLGFDELDGPGWWRVPSNGWILPVGDIDGWLLTLDWATGRIGVDVTGPDTWVASSAVNLIESCALGQSIYGDRSWREAVPVAGRGEGWGLDVPSARFRGLVPEVAEASSPWNRWYLDAHVAVHGWLTTYEVPRREPVMAWYRDRHGRRLIESVAEVNLTDDEDIPPCR